MIEWLRPRWRHRDPHVRAAAVRAMGPQDDERLKTIARSDPDAGVRRIAVKKLDDPQVLEAVVAADADAAVRELAAGRLAEVRVAIARSDRSRAECETALAGLTDERALATVAASGQYDTIRQAALARIDGARALRDVVREAADPAIRRAAVDRIDDPAILRSVAMGDFPADVALRALERITDAATLATIADSRTAAKAIRARARSLLGSPTGDRRALGHKQGRARQLALTSAVEALSLEADVVRAGERVRELQREWDEIAKDVPPREDATARFAKACAALLEEAATEARRRADVDRARTALEDRLAARRALCERVERLDGADALRELDEARAAWHRLPAVAEEHAGELAKRFELACQGCAARHERWRAHAGRRAAFEALVEEAEALASGSPLPPRKTWHAVERRWAALDPSDLTHDESALFRHRFVTAGERLALGWQEADARRGERERDNLRRLETLSARLKELAAAETTDLRAARRALQGADAALADIGPLPPSERAADWSACLTDARDELRRRVAEAEEVEEWRRWANVAAQEEIIKRVEALLEGGDLAEGTRQLGRLAEDWAAVASVPPDKSQALWDRFRTARNELRRRCDAYLAENLEKKRALCAQVAELGDSTEWNATAETIKRLQAEWKTIGPVPGRHAQSIWQQFREPCDRFFARRKEHFARVDAERTESAQQKIALCERAEALADSTDWDVTAAAIKKLQAEWKRSGPPPRGQSEELWRRFRTACDRFFDRSRRRDEIAHEAGLRRAEEICDELEALGASLGTPDAPPVEDVAQRLDAAWAEWLRLGVPTLADPGSLHERLRVACERIVANAPDVVETMRLTSNGTRKRREKLCARLEALVEAANPPSREPSLQEMALALRERLATNTIAGTAGRTGRATDVGQEIDAITASWAQLGPVLDDESRALAERFERAHTRARSV